MKLSEDGFSLPELLIAIPMLIIISFAMLNVFSVGTRNYRDFLGDWELIQQVRVPMDEIGHDIRYCREIQVERTDSNTAVLKLRRRYLEREGDYWQRYKMTRRGAEDYWITKNGQPIMGKTSLTAVRLATCECEPLADNKVRVAIAGINTTTGHRFRLSRVFYSYGCGIEPAGEDT